MAECVLPNCQGPMPRTGPARTKQTHGRADANAEKLAVDVNAFNQLGVVLSVAQSSGFGGVEGHRRVLGN